MTSYAIADTAALTGRSLKHITRSLDTIITTTIMPIAFLLLFVFVFGGAIDVGTAQYVDYLLPGILVITIASGAASNKPRNRASTSRSSRWCLICVTSRW